MTGGAVAIGDGRIPLGRGVVIAASELELRTSRSSGPGGQGVNTTDSKVELRWDVHRSPSLTDAQRALVGTRLAHRLTADGVLVLQGSEHRSQHRNREAVIARLQALVSEALTPPRPRRATRPTRSAQQRRLDDKRARSGTKELRRRPEE
jgi:ribosome-associated protein